MLKQIYGRQATQLYGINFTGTGLASLLIIGLVESSIGRDYYKLFYLFGTLAFISSPEFFVAYMLILFFAVLNPILPSIANIHAGMGFWPKIESSLLPALWSE